MPSPKKTKRKSPADEKQKSLFSFVEKTEVKKEEKSKPIAKKEDKALEDQLLPQEPPETKDVKEEIKVKAEPVIKGTPKKQYFKSSGIPFGLKENGIQLQHIKRESVSTKYIRYLIEKGELVEDLERGLLLDVDYDGGLNKAYCKFYDLDTDDIKIWVDTTDHEPYCLSKEPISMLEQLNYTDKAGRRKKLVNFDGFKRFEEIKRFELLTDKEIPMTRIYGKTPIDIGGSGLNVKNILAENEKKAWEADIRYHLNYILDRQLVPGLIYRIKSGKLEKIDFKESSEDTKKLTSELRILFKDEKPEMQEFAEKFIDIFLTPIPDVKRLAMDIEVKIGEHDYRIPDARLAKQEIIAISFVASDGLKLVYVLEREGFTFDKLHAEFPDDAKLYFFKSEKELLTESFRIMWEYPVIITFNGDNFDLNYMFHRAEKLKIDKDLNPIHVKRGFGIMAKAECDLRKGIHIDVFNFFFNRSISGYAFGGSYQSSSLNAISDALLGEKKYEHEEEIHDMEYDVLSWYNLKDSILTLELTKFNNSLVWNLIILLCRITKLPMHDMIRRQISTWIQNIFYFEHRRKEILIPRKSEISDAKKGGALMSKFNGEKFQGAYVIDPVPGIHYDVVVMDFASLYPSIIKEFNLSYETVLCPHKDDEDNLIKGTPYHICSHKMGIFAYVVGFFRDTRVKYFKPKSSDKTLTQKQRSYYHTIQQALKVFINASYGVFGSQNFPLFCLPVAESTTGIGQYSIKQTIKKAEELGVKVLYGDTDSVFLLNPSNSQMKEISDWSKKELDLDLEEEKTYQFLALSQRKKNYIGIYKDTKYVDIKGLVAKKKNTPDFIKKAFSQLIEILKEITNDEEFNQAKKRIIENVKSNLKKIGQPETFTLEDYAINIGLQKNLKDYVKTIPQHVRAANTFITTEVNKAQANNASDDEIDAIKRKFQKGDSVRFIKSKGAIGAKVIEMAKLQDIDSQKYRELLKSALEQVLDALDISFEEISGIKKMDAFF
ncbi:MAG: DNA-directed DNA polymerase I [Candidatus Lokiarchaeota archaeon]|nr:DNA-directed DNA polymerase I [Candidatus Lokiarchaeota archaeon]